MDQEGLYVNIGINSLFFTRAMFDDGCHSYMVISERLQQKLQLPTLLIRPRRLEEVAGKEYGAVDKVAHFDIDIDGHKQQQVWAYVIPRMEQDVLLGLPWARSQQVTVQYSEQGDRFHIGASNTSVTLRKESEWKIKEPLRQVTAAAFSTILQRSRKRKQGVEVFSASLNDIEKALEKLNKSQEPTDPKTKLPAFYHDKISMKVFRPEVIGQGHLPPHRPGIDHAIELEKDEQGREKAVPWGPLYNMTKEELLVLRKTLTDHLEKRWIRVSKSPAGAPVLFVRKPGGGLRFCVDYRKLNEITKKDRTPLPLISETLRMMAKAVWYTKLDVSAAFHKIRIKEGDEWKTAFRTRFGSFEWLVTPFGLTGAPATFQRYINSVLREFLDVCVSAYIDDVIIFTNGSLQEHRSQVLQVLKKLEEAGLQLDINKCEFEQKRVKYLGYIVDSERGICVDPEKVEAIKAWEPPSTVRGVRGFIGFANYYREFIPRFSEIAQPLTNLTKKDVQFQWGDVEQAAFERLKELLVRAPVLAPFDPEKETRVQPDSSGYCIGGELSQLTEDNKWRPVAFYSKKCLPSEVNYPIHDKELLAIVRCLEEWRSMLRSVRSFTILSDHKNLEYFMKKQQLTERQMRWALELSQFRFKIVHQPGKKAVVPDALSRRDQDLPKDLDDERLQGRFHQLLANRDGVLSLNHVTTILEAPKIHHTRVGATWVLGGDKDQAGDEEPDKDDIPLCPFSDSEPKLQQLWKEALSHNKRYWLLRNMVRDGARQIPSKWGLPISISECSVDEGRRLLWRDRIWVPHYEPLRTAIIQQCHDSTLTGHPGRDLLKAIISRRFTWPGLTQDIRQFLPNCDICGSKAIWREKRRGLLKPLPIPERQWSEISIDFITDLPVSKSGATNVMVITDRLFKSCIFKAMKEITVEAVVDSLMECLIQHHGPPSAIVSDRGPQFVSLMWKRICSLMKITRRLSTAFHPETDGSTERMNQELEAYLRCFVSYYQDDWEQLLPIAMLAINGRTSSVTGMSPFFATHGYNIEPIEVEEPLRTEGKTPVARGEALISKLKEATEVAQTMMAAAQEKYETYANRNRRPAEQFHVGDKVWLNLGNIATNTPSKKLDWRNAKYTVKELIGSHAVRLDTPPGIHNVFHVMLLRRAADNPLPSQIIHEPQPPALVRDDGTEEYEVEKILDHRIPKGRRRGLKLLVKWKGYARPTWEPVEEFEETEAYDTYLQHNDVSKPSWNCRRRPRS
jgi:transposase InsO family protein